MKKVYQNRPLHIYKAFELHGVSASPRDSNRVKESMDAGQIHVMAGLKFQPIKGDKVRVYDVRESAS